MRHTYKVRAFLKDDKKITFDYIFLGLFRKLGN